MSACQMPIDFNTMSTAGPGDIVLAPAHAANYHLPSPRYPLREFAESIYAFAVGVHSSLSRVLWPKIDSKLLSKPCGQRGRFFFPDRVVGEVGGSAEQKRKPLLARLNRTIEALVDCAVDCGIEHLKLHRRVCAAQSVRKRPEPVDPSDPLFDLGRIPEEVVMNDTTAMPLKIHPLLHDFIGDEDHWIERRVERLDHTLARCLVFGVADEVTSLDRPLKNIILLLGRSLRQIFNEGPKSAEPLFA